jgi:transcriptional regulator with XRE-family HTH domain
MSKKLGDLIKEARAAKGLTQAAVAEQVDGITASDVGKIERGEKEPTQAVLKKMAKVLGVTQKSLFDAVTGTGKTTAAGKTSSTGKTTAKKTTAAKKTAAKAVNALTLTATEKKLVQLYRDADTKTKKAAINLLEGDSNAIELIGALLSANAKGAGSSGSSSGSSGTSDLISALLSGKTGGSSGGAAGKDTMNALMDLLGKINK